MVELVKRFGYTGTLNDFFDVPEQTTRSPFRPHTASKTSMAEISISEADPMVKRAKQRTIANGVLYGKRIEMINNREERMVNDTNFFL